MYPDVADLIFFCLISQTADAMEVDDPPIAQQATATGSVERSVFSLKISSTVSWVHLIFPFVSSC